MNPKLVLASRQIAYRVVDVKLCCRMKFPVKGMGTSLKWQENQMATLLWDYRQIMTKWVMTLQPLVIMTKMDR